MAHKGGRRELTSHGGRIYAARDRAVWPKKQRDCMAVRINLGCGQKPTPAWRNFDNSFSVLISRFPHVPAILVKTGIVDDHQRQSRRWNI